MRGINKVLIFGRLGHEPELKKTAHGKAFIEISVATNRPIKKGDGWEEKADWHRIRFWEKEAELCEKMLRRGSPVAVEGQLRTDMWIDSEGQKRTKTFPSNVSYPSSRSTSSALLNTNATVPSDQGRFR